MNTEPTLPNQLSRSSSVSSRSSLPDLESSSLSDITRGRFPDTESEYSSRREEREAKSQHSYWTPTLDKGITNTVEDIDWLHGFDEEEETVGRYMSPVVAPPDQTSVVCYYFGAQPTTSESFASSRTSSPDIAFAYGDLPHPVRTNTPLNSKSTDASAPPSQGQLFAWCLEYVSKTPCLLNELSTFMSSDLCPAPIAGTELTVNNENVLRAFMQKHHVLP